MPGIVNMTVKKYDAVTDITFNALSGSAGDNSPAVWRQDSGAVAGMPVGMRSTFRTMGAWNGPKTARRLTLNAVFPYAFLDSQTGLYGVKDRAIFDGVFLLPQGLPSTQINEFVAQVTGLIRHVETQNQAIAGYAST